MDLFELATIGLLLITIVSYLYLIYFFIKEKIYKDVTLFDIVALLSGPIGLLIILLICIVNYDDKQ